jgi:hypothetical protein
MRAATTIAILGLTLAGWSSGAFSQQPSGSDAATSLESAKNSLARGQAQNDAQKDAMSSSTLHLQVNRQALKAGRSGEADALKNVKSGVQDSEARQGSDTLRLEGANKKLSGMAPSRPAGQSQAAFDLKAQTENRSALSARSLKSSLSSASAKGTLSSEKDELKKR